MSTEILASTPEGIRRAADHLRAGHPVVMPTETVYGLAADASSVEAIARVFAAKARPAHDPLIVHVSPGLVGEDALAGLGARGLVDLETLDAGVAVARALAAACWPGPLTLVLPRGPAVPDAVTSGLATVAVRMPAHPVAQALLDAAGLALVAPSANRFGRISPTTARAAATELDGRVELVLDGGPCAIGVESTVLAVLPDGSTVLLRPGGVTPARIRTVTGSSPGEVEGVTSGPQTSPGLLTSHYAPSTPLRRLSAGCEELSAAGWARVQAWIDGAGEGAGADGARAGAEAAGAGADEARAGADEARAGADEARAGAAGRCPVGLLVWAPLSASEQAGVSSRLGRPVLVEVLSPDGSTSQAARRLYAALRRLDESEATALLAEPCPTSDELGLALRDRLRRAAGGAPAL